MNMNVQKIEFDKQMDINPRQSPQELVMVFRLSSSWLIAIVLVIDFVLV